MVVVVRMSRLIIVVAMAMVVVMVVVMMMMRIMVMVMVLVLVLEENRQYIIFVYCHNDESDRRSCLRSKSMYRIHLVDIDHIYLYVMFKK